MKNTVIHFLLVSFALIVQSSLAGSATWNLNPTTGDWNTATNWTPETVPNGLTDTATFGISNTTTISLSAPVVLDSITFASDAGAYTLAASQSNGFTIGGVGIINDSGVVQQFVNRGPASVTFTGNATAGRMTSFINERGSAGGGYLSFHQESDAGSGTFVNEGPTIQVAGFMEFFDRSSAANGTFTMEGGTSPQTSGSTTFFHDNSTAANATFTLNTAAAPAGFGGSVYFMDNSTMANGTFTAESGGGHPYASGFILLQDSASAGHGRLIANGGVRGGAVIYFLDDTRGGTARVEVFGKGRLYLAGHNLPGISLGSIEGDGGIVLGANNLTVGSNNRDTTYQGVVKDGDFGAGGSLTKVGDGMLVLTGASSYTGDTVVRGGTLSVRNRTGSASGTGNLSIEAGRLSGNGGVSGAVSVGTGSGAGAILAPGTTPVSPGTISIQQSLVFNGDGEYQFGFEASTGTGDGVSANGVTINSGASFVFDRSENTALPVGTIFTVIDNTAETPIAGQFDNLMDGSTYTIGTNTFQANYEGGDGNDLTLTVVP